MVESIQAAETELHEEYNDRRPTGLRSDSVRRHGWGFARFQGVGVAAAAAAPDHVKTRRTLKAPPSS